MILNSAYWHSLPVSTLYDSGSLKTLLQARPKKIKVPSFITSAKNEKKSWSGIYEAIPGDKKVSFLPKTKGNHGSRALWEKFDDHKDYWKVVKGFLKQFKTDVAGKG